MSLVSLKRIGETRYLDKVSHNKSQGFSLNGNLRNTSYIGQTSLSKKNKVPNSSRNGGVKGSGGNIEEKEMFFNCCKNDSGIIKPSVKNTKSMLSIRNRHTRRPYPFSIVQPDINLNDNQTQSSYIEKVKNNNNCRVTKPLFEFQNSERDRRNYLKNCLSLKPNPGKVNNTVCFS
jgi:hypothetical protein